MTAVPSIPLPKVNRQAVSPSRDLGYQELEAYKINVYQHNWLTELNSVAPWHRVAILCVLFGSRAMRHQSHLC